MSKLVELEKLLDGTSGRKVTTDEYSDVRNLLDHFEAENNRRFCEFGSLVESLQVSALLYILHTGLFVHYGIWLWNRILVGNLGDKAKLQALSLRKPQELQFLHVINDNF